MTTQFVKILKYNLYPYGSKKKNFEFICGVLNQSQNPDTLKPGKLNFENKKVFSSTLNRAKQSLASAAVFLHELDEISFDVSKYCTFFDWEKNGSNVIRKAFKQAFIDDQLNISRLEILKQARKVFELCKKQPSVVVSHTFRLVVLKAIFKTNDEIINKPELINDYIFDDKRILDFGESFELDLLAGRQKS